MSGKKRNLQTIVTKCPVPDSPQQRVSTFNHFDALTVEDDDIPVNTSDSGLDRAFKGRLKITVIHSHLNLSKNFENQIEIRIRQMLIAIVNVPQIISHHQNRKNVLIIGYSMVKNIDNLKISLAAKTKSTQCHSYSMEQEYNILKKRSRNIGQMIVRIMNQ